MVIRDGETELKAVLEEPAHAGGEKLPLVIILHGLTSAMNRPHTLKTAQAMRDAGYATLRFDLYGHGESGGAFRDHTLYRWISNTLAVIRWAREQGYQELWLSGHSQGGITAALAAGMAPDLVRGLILRAPAFLIPSGAREGNLLGFTFDPDHIPDTVQVPGGGELDGNYLRVAQTIHAEEAADRFKGPVLILQGDADDLVPPESVREIAGRYADCSLEILPGETHHFDRDPERMARIILEWMQKQHR